MPFALVMYFDSLSEKPIRELWQKIADAGITSTLARAGVRPHLTLTIFDQVSRIPREDELAGFARKSHLTDLQATYIGFFSQPDPVVFVAPTPTQELMDFHRSIIHVLMEDAQPISANYLPGTWVPHCTIALDFPKKRIPEVVELCLDLPLPFIMHATQVGVVEFQPMKDLFKCNLTTR